MPDFGDRLISRFDGNLRQAAVDALYREWSSRQFDRDPSNNTDVPWAQAEHNLHTDLNQVFGDFFSVFANNSGRPARFENMLERLGNPERFLDVDDILENPDRETPLETERATVADNVMAVLAADLRAVETLVAGWHGAPANFLAALNERYGGDAQVAHHQLTFIAEVGAVASACKEVIDRARDDILRIIDKTTDVLEDLHRDGGGGGGVEFTLTVAGALASVVGASPWVSVAISLGSYLNGLRDSGEGADEEPSEITGGTVYDVLSSMLNAVNGLARSIVDQVDLIKNAINADLDAVGGARGDFLVLDLEVQQTSPDLVLSTDPAAYSRPQSANIHLVYEDAYKAGRVYLSSAAHHYDTARRRLDTSLADPDIAFGGLIVGAKADFVALKEELVSILGATRDFFEDSGETLCQVVGFYAEADNISADGLREAADQTAERNPDVTTMHERSTVPPRPPSNPDERMG